MIQDEYIKNDILGCLSSCNCDTFQILKVLFFSVSSIHANELSTPNEKPQTSRPRGRGSSVRLEKKKILAKAGRGLSFLSHFSKKANDKVNEDNLEQG